MKKVLILGGSSDIGIELVKKFLKNNFYVFSHFSNNKKDLSHLKKKFTNLKIIRSNFLKINEKNIKRELKIFKKNKYDIIINLIGFIDNKSYANYDLLSLITSLKVNAIIPNLIIRENIEYMKKKNWGRIVNCSTVGVKYGGGEYSYNYNLSKHFLEFIPGKYREWAAKNILINNLRIGHANTKIHKRMKKILKGRERIQLIPIKRMINVQEISEYIFFYATDLNSYVTGETLNILGGE
tara:strand:+ start:1973 stop:2689 length:717 start_codon:yes stop_codon:yes gene_type:complete